MSIVELDNINVSIDSIKKHCEKEKLLEYYLLHLICNIKYESLSKKYLDKKEVKKILYDYRRNALYYKKRFYQILGE